VCETQGKNKRNIFLKRCRNYKFYEFNKIGIVPVPILTIPSFYANLQNVGIDVGNENNFFSYHVL
jgi:hypothetical protein